MNILILGSGGREHAITWKLSHSKRPVRIFVAPGNPGTEEIAVNLPIDTLDFEAIKSAVLREAIEMVIVGPEAPLVEGIRDFFEADPDLMSKSGEYFWTAELGEHYGFTDENGRTHRYPKRR